jgi:hypothetical protein
LPKVQRQGRAAATDEKLTSGVRWIPPWPRQRGIGRREPRPGIDLPRAGSLRREDEYLRRVRLGAVRTGADRGHILAYPNAHHCWGPPRASTKAEGLLLRFQCATTG